MLWLAEAAIQGYFRDVLPAIPQVARGPFETHICEHFVWPDAGRSPKQASKMSRTQAHQSRNAFQRYVPGYTRFNRTARSFRQLRRFHHVINSDKVFGTHSQELATEEPWYSDPKFWAGDFLVEAQADNEDERRPLTPDHIKKGLQWLADNHLWRIEQIVKENGDAETGDVFLQACLLG